MRMPTKRQVESYLSNLSKTEPKTRIKVTYFGPLKEYLERDVANEKERGSEDVKHLGYGVPYLIVSKPVKKNSNPADHGERKLILSTMRVGYGFGHDYRADRVDNLVLAFDTWNKLPNHCKVTDLGTFRRSDSEMLSLRESDEFFLVRPMVEGTEYYKDLDRIRSTGNLEGYDLARAKCLAEYLVKIHSKKNTRPENKILYERKIRDTLGHGECIFGLADSYPDKAEYLKDNELEEIEKLCVQHRWKLRKNFKRLSQVHGDFHPWNILFANDLSRNPTKLLLLDRSRGECGEPADDVCALSINYIFNSLRKYGEMKGEFLALFHEFLSTYLSQTQDDDLLEAMPLFYTFRTLVIASPLWYPDLSSETRRKIFNFAENILAAGSFDPTKVNDYFSDRKQKKDRY